MSHSFPPSMKNRIAELLKSPGNEDHKYPVTRRDLLRMGVLTSAFCVTRPLNALAGVLGPSANPGKRKIPFLVFDCAGGAAFPGNFLVGGAGGAHDLIAEYSTLGWNPRDTDALDMTYGIPMSKQRSKILQGLNANIPSEKRPNFKMGSYLTQALDDTSSNILSAIQIISRAHGGGSVLQSGFGMRTSISGGNSDALVSAGIQPPTFLADYNTIETLGRVDGLEQFNNEQMKMFFKSVASSKSASYNQDVNAASLLLDTKAFDPRSNADMARIYNLGRGNSTALLEAAIVYNALQGNTGPSAIVISSCDYHDSTGTTGDNKDLEIGEKIGRAVAAASALNTPLYIQLITDGGVTSPDSGYERRWTGDSNQRNMSLVGFFKPDGPVKMRREQVGGYLPKGVVDPSTTVGGSNQKMIFGVTANYLHLHGEMGGFADLIGNRGMSNSDIESMLFF